MNSWNDGMTSLVLERQGARARHIAVSEDTLTIELIDGRVIGVPIAWYPRLWYGTPKERANFEILGDGEILHWPELDEDLSVDGILAGKKSGESPRSLKRWLSSRGDQRMLDVKLTQRDRT